MGLKGNLREFNITNILQIVKMEDKTGVLKVQSKADTVQLAFIEGKVVYAYSEQYDEEKRFKYTLVLNRLIQKNVWDSVEKEHRKNLKPYWEILKKYVDEQSLSRLMSLQVTDTVYQLLRWTDGNYEFIPQKKVPYDSRLIQPIDVDFLLMEGSRVVDEWTAIQRKIPPMTAVVRKNILEERELENTLEGKKINLKTKTLLEEEILENRKVTLTGNEKKVLGLIFENTPVETIFYSTFIGQFETSEALLKLMKTSLVKVVDKKATAALDEGKSKFGVQKIGLVAALLVLFIFGALALKDKILSYPSHFQKTARFFDQMGEFEAQRDLNAIAQKLQIYHAMTGKYPNSIDELVQAGLMAEKKVIDPWKRLYRFNIWTNGQFALYSLGPLVGKSDDDIFYTYPNWGLNWVQPL